MGHKERNDTEPIDCTSEFKGSVKPYVGIIIIFSEWARKQTATKMLACAYMVYSFEKWTPFTNMHMFLG